MSHDSGELRSNDASMVCELDCTLWPNQLTWIPEFNNILIMASRRTSSSGNKPKAEERYKSAALGLQNVIPKETCRRLGDITFAEFDTIHGSGKRAKALGDALENLIQARSEVGKKQEAKERYWRHCD